MHKFAMCHKEIRSGLWFATGILIGFISCESSLASKPITENAHTSKPESSKLLQT